MATKYARAGGGNYSADATWSTTSGGAADTVKPTAADDVVLDAASGNVTIDAASVCRGLDCTGYTGTLTHNAFTLTIGDGTAATGNVALKLVAGMTYTLSSVTTSALNFVSSSGTLQTADFGGKNTGNLTATTTAGIQFVSAHSQAATASVTLPTGGTLLNTNGQTCSWGAFSNNNNGTRTLTMGSSSITITGTGTAWNTAGIVTNFTITANTATVTMTGSNSAFAGASKDYNGLTLVYSAFSNTNSTNMTGNNTFANLTRTGPAGKTEQFNIGGNQTCTSTFTCTSNSDINRVIIQSTTVGTTRTITAATVVIGNTVDFMDITGAGAATWTVAGTGATALGDCGGNSGITFTTPAAQTCTMSTNKNWDDATIWTSRIPLPQDDVVMTAVTGGTLSSNSMPRLGKSIDWTGATGSPTWSIGSVSIFGGVTLISGMTFTKGADTTVTFRGRSSYTITSASKAFQSVTINAFGGTYTLNGNFSSTSTNRSLAISNGTFTDAGYNVTLSQSNNGFTCNGTLNLTGAWAVSSGFGTGFDVQSGTFNGSGTITHTGDSGSAATPFTVAAGVTASVSSLTITMGTCVATRTFNGGGKTYGTLNYVVNGSVGLLAITGSNTFGTINFSDTTNARTLRFSASATNTITNSFNVNGTAGKLMSVISSTGGTPATLTKSSGTISCDYLSIQDSTATGGAAWYAGANSTNVSGNTGWIFTAPPSGAFFQMF